MAELLAVMLIPAAIVLGVIAIPLGLLGAAAVAVIPISIVTEAWDAARRWSLRRRRRRG